MDKQTFEEYAKIKNQIKELTAEAKELEPELVNAMQEAGVEKAKTEFGGFTLKTYTSVELTDEAKKEIKKLEEEIEAIEEVKNKRKDIEDIKSQGKVVEKQGIMFK